MEYSFNNRIIKVLLASNFNMVPVLFCGQAGDRQKIEASDYWEVPFARCKIG